MLFMSVCSSVNSHMLKEQTTTDLINQYSNIIKELKERGVIRTKNLLGDLGEYLAIEYYCNTGGLPKLQAAPANTKNIDAISINGDRYSVKSTTGKLTGVFWGLEPPDSKKKDKPKFEYVIIVMFDDDYELEKIIELDWDLFLKHKKWHKTMSSWNLRITEKLIDDSNIIYSK